MANGTQKIASWAELNTIIYNRSAADGYLEEKTLWRSGDIEKHKKGEDSSRRPRSCLFDRYDQ